ncbi:MAG: glycosyltransferase family 39 protein [Prolixibacteraceae bacterium]|jgi:4-amino-4-deoxy-L-arabinose transferase-like glycosyltransferase|nr:glycosyltransferase family 39 protein [Prolixibacteraceae bacterium]
MTGKFIHSKYFPFLLFAFALFLYTVNNGNFSIYILDEAKNTECAREMLERGDWVVPTFNYNLRADKPPLHYFFMMAAFKLFGINEWGARFFSGIFGALTVLITFLYTRRFVNYTTAFWAAFTLLASVHFSIQFHLAVPDPYLIFFFTWSLFLFYAAVSERRRHEIWLLYVAVGLGTLAKGPVAIALPGLIFLLFLIFSKQLKWTVIRSLKPFSGMIIVLAISLPWYILVGLETDWEWTRGFFLKHNIGRFAEEMEGHGGIFIVTFAYVLVGMFPFSAFLVQAYRNALKNRHDWFVLFSLTAASVIILFFSFSGTKLPNYTVPSYPFLAVLLAGYFSRLPGLKTNIKPSYTGLLLTGIILVPALLVGLQFDPVLKNEKSVAWYFLPSSLGIFAGFYFFIQKKNTTGLLVTGSSTILAGLLFFLFVFPRIDAQNPVRKSISLLENKDVRYFQRFNPSYSFYLKKPVPEISENEISVFFEKYPDGVIISVKKKLDDIQLPENTEIFFSSHDLFESPTTQLVRKKKTD